MSKKTIKFEIEKRNFNKLIKGHFNYIYKYEGDHVLNGIMTKIKDKNLILLSTDGNRLLKTEMQIDVDQDLKQVLLNGLFLSRIKIINGFGFSKNSIDLLEIKLNKDGMEISDLANKISYKIPTIAGKYPNVEKFIKKPRSKQTFTLNVAYLKDLKNLEVNERTSQIDLVFNKKSNLTPVVIETDNGEGIKTSSIIMPIQKR